MAWRVLAGFFLGTVVLGSSSCSVVAAAQDSVAPGDYGRPAVVRVPACVGAVVGGVTGLVASVVLWPVTKGLNLVFEEPLGYCEREWALLPVTTGAALGHYGLGLPGEVVYFVCYGAWVGDPAVADFDHVPTGEVDGVESLAPRKER